MPRHDLFFPPKDADLREDVHSLGGLVGQVIREQGGDALFEAVEKCRQAAIARREGDAEGTTHLMGHIRGISADTARDLVRSFSTWFEMVNMAEKVHRIRRRRQYMNEGATQPSGVEDAIVKLKALGMPLSDVRRLMLELWIEPVLTAHPTESTRRTILRKQKKVAQLLLSRLGLAPNATEMRTIWHRVRASDRAGNTSGNVTGASNKATRYTETTSLASYSSGWGSLSVSSAFGGRTRSTTRAGATVTVRFNGTAIGWISRTASNRGAARVYVDGALVKTVDTRGSTAARRLVFAANHLADGPHTLKIVVVGTSGRPRVDVDGFVVLR